MVVLGQQWWFSATQARSTIAGKPRAAKVSSPLFSVFLFFCFSADPETAACLELVTEIVRLPYFGNWMAGVAVHPRCLLSLSATYFREEYKAGGQRARVRLPFFRAR
jgi:hypothetical protein